jgi:hypothetical protein
MFEALRKRFRPVQAEPCRHGAGGKSALVFDWYRDVGIATCGICGEVFLASELGEAPDWAAIPPNGGFDGP